MSRKCLGSVAGLDNESLRRLALRCADPLRLRTALHLQLPARLFERCVPLLWSTEERGKACGMRGEGLKPRGWR